MLGAGIAVLGNTIRSSAWERLVLERFLGGLPMKLNNIFENRSTQSVTMSTQSAAVFLWVLEKICLYIAHPRYNIVAVHVNIIPVRFFLRLYVIFVQYPLF